MVLALLTPVMMVIGGPTPLRHIATVSTGTGPNPAFGQSEVWDGGNLVEGCPMCISASTASTVSQPSTDPSKTVDPATGDLSESYTMAAISDPGGGQLNLTLTYDGESAAQQQATNQFPAPWGYGWSDNWHVQIDATGSDLQYLEGNGAIATYYPYDTSTASCPTGDVLKSPQGSTALWCAAPRVGSQIDETSTSYIVTDGTAEQTFNLTTGQLQSQGTLQNPAEESFYFDASPGSGTNQCNALSGGACNLEVDAAGRQLDEFLGTNGYVELVLGPGPTAGSTNVYYANTYTATGSGEQLTGITNTFSTNGTWSFGYNQYDELDLMTDPQHNQFTYTWQNGLVQSANGTNYSYSDSCAAGDEPACTGTGDTRSTAITPAGESPTTVTDSFVGGALQQTVVGTSSESLTTSYTYGAIGADTNSVTVSTPSSQTTTVTDPLGNQLAQMVSPPSGVQTFTETGSIQPYTVPSGVSALYVKAVGAGGGAGYQGSTGGLGGAVTGYVPVTAGETLYVQVGGAGGAGADEGGSGAGGYGGGGSSGSAGTPDTEGGGGGGSFIFTSATPSQAAVVVAAGGGGGAGSNDSVSANGGNGGNPGAAGINEIDGIDAGGGATQTAPGAGGTYGGSDNPPAGGLGGSSSGLAGGAGGTDGYGGGGGGGGYYGGGGGASALAGAGGGGGASWVSPAVSGASYFEAIQSGAGQVVIVPVEAGTVSQYNSLNEPCWTAAIGAVLPSLMSCASAPASGATTYTYDADNYGNLVAQTDPDGNTTNYGYYSGSLASAPDSGLKCWMAPPGISVSGATCTSPPSGSTQYQYDLLGDMSEVLTPDTNNSMSESTATYNNVGQTTSTVSPDGYATGNPSAYTTTYNYGPSGIGLLASTTAPMGRTTTYTYNALGQPTQVASPPVGSPTPYSYYAVTQYDTQDRPCATATAYQTAPTLAANCAWATGETTTSYVGTTSAVHSTTDGNDHSTTYLYQDPRFPTSPTTVDNSTGSITSTTAYGANGKPCLSEQGGNLWGGSGLPSCTWAQGDTATTYDALGNTLSSVDPDGYTLTYTYGDPRNPTKPTAVTTPASTTPATVTYNGDGQPMQSTNPSGVTVTYVYNQLGELCWDAPVAVQAPTCGSPATDVTGTNTYVYQPSGALFVAEAYSGSSQTVQIFNYDAQGQQVSSFDTATGTVNYGYDPAGDVTCVGYTVGTTTGNCANGPGTTNPVVDYGYDNDGRMTSAQDWTGHQFSFSYVTASTSGVENPSQVATIAYPSGSGETSTGFTYQSDGSFATETNTGDYAEQWSWGENSIGLAGSETGTGVQSVNNNYAYNSANQVTSPGGYTYYPNGEMKTNSLGGVNSTYTYGTNGSLSTDELTSVSSSSGTTSYGYTPEGQRCWSASGTYSNSCSSPPAGATLDSWNAYGELCSVGPNPSTSGCTGNTAPTAGDTSYTYDAEGLRATETNASGVTEGFTYDTATRPGQPLILTDGSDAYVYGPATFGQATPPLEEISLTAGTATDIISNDQGPVALTAGNGMPGTYTYNTYGQQTVVGASIAFGFQGAYQGGAGFSDGLLYMVNRYYDPTVGQFVSVDPNLAKTGQPYAYVGDQPTELSDPTGLSPSDASGLQLMNECIAANGQANCVAFFSAFSVQAKANNTITCAETPIANITLTTDVTVSGADSAAAGITTGVDKDGYVYNEINLQSTTNSACIDTNISTNGAVQAAVTASWGNVSASMTPLGPDFQYTTHRTSQFGEDSVSVSNTVDVVFFDPGNGPTPAVSGAVVAVLSPVTANFLTGLWELIEAFEASAVAA